MKRTLQQLSSIANTAMTVSLPLGGVRRGLLLLALVAIMMPSGAWAQNSTPTYIASIGVAQDGSSGSTGVNDCKSELSGHVIIDRDLNDGAGGDYVYMGYKTTTDPSNAITGIVFRVGGDPPSSITYQGYTFNLVGGEYEKNTASPGGWIDLNGRAGGVYIYTYVTRASSYGAPLTSMIVNGSSSHSDYITATNTSGNVINLNQEAGGDYLCLHYQRFSATVKSTFHYLTSDGTRTSSTLSKNVSNHLTALTSVPSVASSVTYGGRTFTFRGWREDNTAAAPTVTSPSATYITGNKVYRAVYSTNVTLSYDANGGSGAPAAQTATQYLNAGSSSVSQSNASFTVPSTKPVYATKCFLGWSADASSTTASYKSGSPVSVSGNTTLYAVFSEHEYAGNQCSVCGHSVTYIDRVWNSTTKQLDESVKTAPANIVEVTSATTAMSSGWYLAKGTVNITEPITVSGTVHLILTDGASLTSVQCTVNEGNAIYIYAQSSGENMGSWRLDPNGGSNAALGGEARKNPGKIVINGGAVSAYVISSSGGAAIGGGYEGGSGGEITINGGSVTARVTNGFRGGAGIGGGGYGEAGSIAINGGTIQTYASDAYGIGRGVSGKSGSVTINGGNISVSSGEHSYTISGTVKNSAGDNVDRVLITLSGASDGDAVTKVAGITYGLTDVETLNTTLYFYLPSGTSSNITAITAGGKEYLCKNGRTFYASHDWSKKNGVCAHGCGTECAHENHTGSTCEICGSICALGHSYVNGFCSACDSYEPAADTDSDGYYEIDNAGKLYWFAAQVSDGNTAINGKLTADITVNENVLVDGVLNSNAKEFRAWTPIGSSYVGTFDGGDHTVSGLYFANSNVSYVGLFKSVAADGKVQNVGVIDSYIFGSFYVGGVVGYNYGTVTNCYNTGRVVGPSGDVGGVVGLNYGIVTDCYHTGTVSGGDYIGGVVGSNYPTGKVADCYDIGTVSGDRHIGGVVGYNNGSVTNSYYDQTVYSGTAIGTEKGTSTNAEGKTTGQFASGEVAYLLQGEQAEQAWGQAIGSDPYPVLGGAAVYVGYAGNGDGTLTLYDGDALGYTNHTAFDRVTLHRTLGKGKYGTICLPFAPDAATLQHYAFYALSGAEDDVLRFEEVAAPEAGVPYLYGLRDEGTEGTPLTASDVTIVTAPAAVEHESGFTMHGSLSSSVIDCAALWETTYHYAYSADRQELNRITKTLNVTPFRAYLTLPATADVSKVRVRIVTRGDENDGETTDIDPSALNSQTKFAGRREKQPSTLIYDLQGRRVENPAKGVYIVNGRKVVIK